MQRFGAKAEEAIRALNSARDAARRCNAFTNYASEESLLRFLHESEQDIKPLSGVLVAIKDNICTFGLPTTCASKALKDFQSPQDATVVKLLRAAGGLIVGKTNMDEFGMGSHSHHSVFGSVQSPTMRSPGGSSGGSAVAVATKQCDVALGTDTGGSVRLPAAYNDIFGFKPSYGMISRSGVIDYANSLDTVGFLARDCDSLKSLFDTTNAFDENDPTSLEPASRERLGLLLSRHETSSRLRIGIPAEFNIIEMSPLVRHTWSKTLQALQHHGHFLQTVSIPSMRQALSAYYVLAPAEASSNLAKYDNVRYGSVKVADEDPSLPLYSNFRQKSFGDEVRRRILLGTYTLSAAAIDNYFIQAQRIRRSVQQDLDNIFALPNSLCVHSQNDSSDRKVDALICPTAPTLPPAIEDVSRQRPLDAYASDIFTVVGSLAGVPAVSVPMNVPKGEYERETHCKSIGMQVMTQFGDDQRALKIAALLESIKL